MPGQCWDGTVTRLIPKREMRFRGHRISPSGRGVTTIIKLSGAVNMTGYSGESWGKDSEPGGETDPFFLEAGI